MSKFNQRASVRDIRQHPQATENFEGGLAFNVDAKTRLYSRVVTSLFGEDKFYQSGKEHDKAILFDIEEVATRDPEFILKLAAYARNEMYLRTVPIVLLAEAAAIPACKPFIREWTPRILRRADEPLEVLAYWMANVRQKSKIPKQLRLGIQDALNGFDEYQLEKYRNEDGQLKTSDLMRIVHPEAKDFEHDTLFHYLRRGQFKGEPTPKIAAKIKLLKTDEFNDEARSLIREGSIPWEVAIAKFGNKKEVWDALQLPFMAMLRNLRNIIQAGADLRPAIEALTSAQAVARSKQFPFRFYNAYKQLLTVPGSDRLLGALSQAISLSAGNIPKMPGKTLIACDNSGSMDQSLSNKSSITYKEIANLFGSMAYGFCEEWTVMAFGTHYAMVVLNPGDSVFTNMQRIERADTQGYSTNGYRVIKQAREKGYHFDRMIFLSDLQCYSDRQYNDRPGAFAQELQAYRSSINPKLFVHSIDLAGYGTALTAPDDPRSSLIAGWNEKVFQFIPLFEQEKTTAIQVIEAYRGVEDMGKSAGKKFVGIYLPEDMRKQLKIIAAMNDKSMSEIVEAAVKRYLKRNFNRLNGSKGDV